MILERNETLLERNETRLERNETYLKRNETLLERNETRSGNLYLSGTVAFQEQMGGNVIAQEPGRFEFTLNLYVDCISELLGVQERHFTANLRQQGQFMKEH